MMPSAAWTEVLRKNALSVAGLAMIESENPVSRDEETCRVRPAGQPGRGARRGSHLLGVLVPVRRGARPRGRLDEARLAFEKMLTHANHVGLYAEQISRGGQQQGNFPQALTHLALISAAFNLDRALGA